MKLTVAVVIASILILGLVDFSDATFLPWPPAPCEPPKPPVKPPVKPPKPPKPPVKPPQPPKPPKPPVKPPVKPCEPPKCGPGGVACHECPSGDNLCKEIIKLVNDLDVQIKKCVCGVKFV